MSFDIKQITYRGSLKSCNYTCFYCPFSKNKISKAELSKDEILLNKFIKKLDESNFTENIEILFTPYGEGLIHDYYRQAIGRLTKKDYISKVGCQSNLSFDVENFIKLNINFNKIYLWATFHPSMIFVDEFVNKVSKLEKYVNICVGVVGNPEDINLIIELRKKLPVNVYMWINKMDGLGRKYTDKEVLTFSKLDPMFMLEVNKFSNYECGPRDVFIDSSGKIYKCNRNKKVLGNIYDKFKIEAVKCDQKKCDCYLAYSHTKIFKENKFIGVNNLFRLPSKIKPKVVFFDVDGTLTEDRETLIKTFEYISSKIPIYLATELPENIAYKKIGFLKKYISGGVFAGGSYITDYKSNYKHIEALNNLGDKFLNNEKSYLYKEEDKIYRVITSEKVVRNYDFSDDFSVIRQNKNMYSIVPKGVDKFFGISNLVNALHIDVLDVLCVGNDYNDIKMLEECGISVGVIDGCEEVLNVVDFILNVSHIPFIL